MCEEIESNDESVNEMDEMVKEFYVYVYLDPRKEGKYVYGEFQFDYEPFYVGKGYGFRKFRHMSDYVLKTDKNKLKVNKIKKILSEGLECKIIEYKSNITEKESFDLEKLMIATIGRYDLGKGPLTNLTDGGEGDSGKIMSDEQKQILREQHLGMKASDEAKNNMSLAQFKRHQNMSEDEKKAISEKLSNNFKNMTEEEMIAYREKCKNSWTEEKRNKMSEFNKGENNPNYGNKWNDEQKKKLSDHQKVNSNFVKNNPQKINPNRGDKCGNSTFTYFCYDYNCNLVYRGNSIAEITDITGLGTAHIVKAAKDSSGFTNGYYIERIQKENADTFVFTNELKEKINDYRIRYLIGQKLKLGRTLVAYYRFIIYKDNKLLLDTYNPSEVNKKFGDTFFKHLRKGIFDSENGGYYKEYFIKRIKLTEEFLNETA